METLAYLHLTLANEAPEETTLATGDCPHFGRTALVPLLSLTIALGVFGTASQASATIKQGDRGSQVTTLQQRLQSLGYFQGKITGYFGPITKAAVVRFQQAQRLAPDGIVGQNTEVALGGVVPPRPPVPASNPQILRLGDRGLPVSALQESLAVAGFCNRVNGVFDAPTQAAVRSFQQSKGLIADGVVGPQTRAVLPAIGGLNPLPPLPLRNLTRQLNTQTLQERLQAQGFYRGSVDGIWGPQTQAAVEAAQRAYNVSAVDIKHGRF